MGRQLSLQEELYIAREQHPGSNVRPIFGGKAIEVDAPNPRVQQPIEGLPEAEAQANERTRQRLGQAPLLGLELGA